MVKLNLKEIFKTRRKFSLSYVVKPEDIKLPSDLGEIKEPISLYVEITKDKGAYKVYMEIEGYVVLECSRCLTLYHKDVGKKGSGKGRAISYKGCGIPKASRLGSFLLRR